MLCGRTSPSSRLPKGEVAGGTASEFLALVNRVRDSGPCACKCGCIREEMRGPGWVRSRLAFLLSHSH